MNGHRRNPRPMGPPGMAGNEKAKDLKGTFVKLLGHLAKYRVSLVVVLLCAAGSAIFSIIGPKVLGNATTTIFNGLMSKLGGSNVGIDFAAIGRILITLLILYLISAGFSYIQGFLMSGISQKVSYRFRKQISEKIQRLPIQFFDKQTHGEVLSRVTNDVDTLSQSLNQSMTQLITSIATIIGVLIMMLSISRLMTLSALVLLPLSLLGVTTIVKRSQKFFVQQQEYLGHVNGQVEEVYGGQTIIKAFNAQDLVTETFARDNDMLYQSAWKSQFFSSIMMPLMSFIGNMGYVVVSILGGWLAARRAIEVGEIQSFIQYVRMFNQPIAQMAQVANMLQSTMAAAERVFEFLAEEEEDQTVPNPTKIDALSGAVTFDHVHFGYTPERIIIQDFSSHVRDGQRVAIVGPTGAGKTTMVKLLMRFYDVTSGAILVDGHNLRSFNRNELRDMFGMVLQDTWLFNGTIMENIRYGRLEATDEEVIEAAKAAHVHHFVQTLPDGYQMVLNEEVNNISQGQKQLLTIARAILANPRIMILDEATSSVDTRTEVRIQKAMRNLTRGRTSFIIAHRLSTIRDADLILVMRDGDIVEQGTHESLLAANGFYATLYNAQFEQVNA